VHHLFDFFLTSKLTSQQRLFSVNQKDGNHLVTGLESMVDEEAAQNQVFE
jgi:hypothetical protein